MLRGPQMSMGEKHASFLNPELDVVNYTLRCGSKVLNTKAEYVVVLAGLVFAKAAQHKIKTRHRINFGIWSEWKSMKK